MVYQVRNDTEDEQEDQAQRPVPLWQWEEVQKVLREEQVNFYWVKYEGEWTVAQCIRVSDLDFAWLMCGTDELFDKNEFDEIGKPVLQHPMQSIAEIEVAYQDLSTCVRDCIKRLEQEL